MEVTPGIFDIDDARGLIESRDYMVRLEYAAIFMFPEIKKTLLGGNYNHTRVDLPPYVSSTEPDIVSSWVRIFTDRGFRVIPYRSIAPSLRNRCAVRLIVYGWASPVSNEAANQTACSHLFERFTLD